MIPLAPNPIFFSLGPIDIRYYGLVYALGFLFVYWWLRRQAKKKRFSLTSEQIDTFMIYAILGGVLGGRFGEFLFFQQNTLLSDPLQVFRIWEGGMSIHGGILGFLFATHLFCKKYKKKIYEITDTVVVPASLVLVFGRIANFINAELIGTITRVPWAINWFGERGSNGELIGRHPVTLYKALKDLVIFGVLAILHAQETTKKKFKEGYLTWIFILVYGGLRVITDIWRADTKWAFNILGTGQILSLLMATLAIAILIKQYWLKKNTKKIKKQQQEKK
jgi:phosphatidylglycerol---prolipoprotein diacylglyceryl transferase